MGNKIKYKTPHLLTSITTSTMWCSSCNFYNTLFSPPPPGRVNALAQAELTL